MPHFKCVACKTRLHGSASPPDNPCPECGLPLEPVGVLAEVVGFRSITPLDHSGDGGAPRLGDLTARREAAHARARLDAEDAERWIDDGDSFRAEAVALPRPETNL